MVSLRRQSVYLVVIAIGVLLITLAIVFIPRSGTTPGSSLGPVVYPAARFVGVDACRDCHPTQTKQWAGSHHDLAMQPANESTVLGDFDNTGFTRFGITSTFSRRDGKFFVKTEGPDGAMHDYEVAYTFGVYPLQQYLVAFPGGRYQVLSLCWDARSKEQGGQRWYHLYADEPVPAGDELHWTGPNQNWNFMCAECHSTDLQKNYDLESDSYRTAWAEVNVSCEACHGPGSNHVSWARDYERGKVYDGQAMGLAFVMPKDDGTWQFEADAVTAQRTVAREDCATMQMCARCHSRRSVIADRYAYGQDLLDTHRLELLEEGLYFDDGQIRDEVYVYGSFLQSKMYAKGVTCTDCHDPHSMRVYTPDNGLCAKCHLPEHFDTPKHHFHEQDTEASRCVACHMPTRTYMGVDERLDHSIRVPRPDLSVAIGTPNACNKCHDDQTFGWAVDAVEQWYGPDRRNEPHFGEVIHAGRVRASDANGRLVELAGDAEQPAIVRATAVSLLAEYPTRYSFDTLRSLAHSDESLVRLAVVRALEMTEPAMRLQVAFDLLDDPVLAVRLEAGRVLAPADLVTLEDAQRRALQAGVGAYIESQLVNADRAESHLNIALVRMQQGDIAEAERSYLTALRINPAFAQGYVNLADLYRAKGEDSRAVALLQGAIADGVDHGVMHYSLGLALVRQGRTEEAIKALESAFAKAPEDPRFGYTLGIALNTLGDASRALDVLEQTHQAHPADQATLQALMTISRDRGDTASAIRYAEVLLELNPPNAQAVRAFIRELRALRSP